MGQEKKADTTVVNQTSTPTPTAEETRMNQIQLQDYEASQQQRQALTSSGLNLGNLLLQGMQLPGYLQPLAGGISPDVTQSIVDQSLEDIKPSFQQGGILDSGVAASISARTASDIRNQSSQFNLQNLAQLLNLATGQGQANPLGFQSDLSGQLGSRLAGLRSNNLSGTTTSTMKTNQNPFLNSVVGGLTGGIGTGLGGAFGKKYF